MAAPNENGCFPSEADEYEFVLNNALLWDAVFNEFRYDPVLDFGNYRQVSTVVRTQILRWVRRQDFYWDEVLGLNEEEDIDEQEEEELEQQQGVVEQQNNVVDQQNNVVDQQHNVVEQHHNVVEQQPNLFEDRLNLASRITALEIFFKEYKERVDRRGNDASRAESSGSNRLG